MMSSYDVICNLNIIFGSWTHSSFLLPFFSRKRRMCVVVLFFFGAFKVWLIVLINSLKHKSERWFLLNTKWILYFFQLVLSLTLWNIWQCGIGKIPEKYIWRSFLDSKFHDMCTSLSFGKTINRILIYTCKLLIIYVIHFNFEQYNMLNLTTVLNTLD